MRIWRKFLAFIRRTFVTDCPVCRLHFYGTNNYGVHKKINGVNYRIVCHRCTGELK